MVFIVKITPAVSPFSNEGSGLRHRRNENTASLLYLHYLLLDSSSDKIKFKALLAKDVDQPLIEYNERPSVTAKPTKGQPNYFKGASKHEQTN